MKKTHIAIIILVAVAIGAMVATLGMSGDEYADFTKATANQDTEYHVVGKCDKNKAQEYNPAVDTDAFTFYMIDKDNVEKKVVLHKSKPQDFERAEQIVIIGKMQGDEFHAKDILMKCPSKYNNEKPTATASKG